MNADAVEITEITESKCIGGDLDAMGRKRIDPRIDISISDITSEPLRKQRKLNKKEKAKLERSMKEEVGIYAVHPGLQEEERLLLADEEEVVVDYSPVPHLATQLMEHQLYGISWMKSREQGTVKGGILADEMGLGKTLQMIGLMLRGTPGDLNLVIVPAIALPQWVSEMEKHAPNAFRIVEHHGRTKAKAVEAVAGVFNVFLTTYGTVESSYRRRDGVLHGVKFTRVVLDEAHAIKDNRCSTAKAVSMLKTKYRWGLTGTPVQNRVNDLLSLVKFLNVNPQSMYFCKKCSCRSSVWMGGAGNRTRCSCGHPPASHFSWWNRRIANPIRELGQTEQGSEYFERLNLVTRQLILRRTKMGLEKSLGLPSKVVVVKRCFFTPQELVFYTSLYSETKGQYNEYAEGGRVQYNYAHIFELLQKMRLAVNHPFLTHRSKGTTEICGYCHDAVEDPVRAKCGHVFCRGEAEVFLQEMGRCPVCCVPITIDLTAAAAGEAEPGESPLLDGWISSTKIETLVEMLGAMQKPGRAPKSIVFSQFVKFLEILRWRLERAGFRCVKIYGSMTIGQRKAAIEEFNKNPDVTVFLISLKAGGVAMNLTEAEHVFIMDLWWNPAVEEQAMDRIHRIGQHRPIRIYRIIIEDSIESRVLQLQKKKKALFETAVENNMEALQRLSEEDLDFLFC